MEKTIHSKLEEIEESNHVRIFYACESGSRAWGFPSADSDYDIRFLYVHPQEWYLSIEDRRQVIEVPVQDNLDFVGWDIMKALRLFRKSNPPLLEWLNSPIEYLDKFSIAENIRGLITVYYEPAACIYHYLHMARGNHREYLKGEKVWLKKYFYVLRPLLAIRWIEQQSGTVPVLFQVLVDRIVTSVPLKTAIEELVSTKLNGNELGYGPRITVISDFIESELSRLEQFRASYQKEAPPSLPLDRLFQTSLAAVWQH